MSPNSSLKPWSDELVAVSSGSVRGRHRSGSGPKYEISLIASWVCRNAGISAGKVSAATRFISLCPRLPQAHPGWERRTTRQRHTRLRDRSEYLFIVYHSLPLVFYRPPAASHCATTPPILRGGGV